MIAYHDLSEKWTLIEAGQQTRWFDSEHEALMATQSTAIDTFGTLNSVAQETAKSLLRQLDELNDLLSANPQIAEAANTAESGALVGTSSLSTEQVLTAIALINSIRSYVDSDLLPGLKIRHAVYTLG